MKGEQLLVKFQMKQSTVFPHFLHSNCIPGKLIFKTMQEYIVVYLKLS